MEKITQGSIKIRKLKELDRQYGECSRWETNYWGYVEENLLVKLWLWEAPLPMGMGISVDFYRDALAYRFKTMNAQGQVYQFNCNTDKIGEYIRMVSVLGEPSTNRISDFEAYVQIPFYQFICKILNKIAV